ncbi:CHASE domain-containing protein [Aerolutibacter ruishenii]|nr:CHASE domain-containing protein [Lysobacter ruishenii]
MISLDPVSRNDHGLRGRAGPRKHLLALAVLLGSLGIVVALWRVAYQRELEASRQGFVQDAETVVERVRQRMVKHELVLMGGASLFASIARPTPGQWRAYVDQLEITNRFPGMVGLGFAGYVSQAQMIALQREWMESGYGRLEVSPRGIRPYYGPILYLEPRTAVNSRAVGFDMFSEPVRHRAMADAGDMAMPRLTGLVQLVQDGDQQRESVLLYVPVYLGGLEPRTLSGRRQGLLGWVYAPMRLEPFVRAALGEAGAGSDLRFSIADVTDEGARPLFSSLPSPRKQPPAFVHVFELDHYGRRWRFTFHSGPIAVAAPQLRGLYWTGALGVLVSLLMYAVAWTLVRTQARARALAERMTEDLRRSEERFRIAVEHSAIGKALLDRDERVVGVNAALAKIVGRDRGSLAGTALSSLFAVGESRESIDEQGIRRSNRQIVRQDGDVREVQLTFSPIPGNVGQDVASLVQVEDITERVRAEARVHALNRTLEARVALRTRELSQANQELEAFAYSVSHDLRAPLRAIDGFSRVLIERYARVMDEEGVDYLGRVRKAASRMGELIDALLKMSRVGRGEMRLARLDLSRLAGEVVEELRLSAPERHVDVVIAPGMAAEGDAALVRNLLGNLLGNAWKFTRNRPDARIEIGVTGERDGMVEFFVRDNGAGFTQEYADKLFRPFQRLHRQEEFAGHGIGLASVKRIVERHGGEVRAEGREGEGAALHFSLPAIMEKF